MNENIKNSILSIIGTIIGAGIIGFGTGSFLLPSQLSTGGFSGIATITYYLFQIPMGTMNILLNIPMFIFSGFRIGKNFFIKTIIGTVSLSVFIDFFDKYPPITTDRFLASIYGGLIIGLGTAIILKSGSSTGGSELIANLIKSYIPNITISKYLTLIDAIIVLANVIVFKHIEIGLYSAIAIYLYGKMIDIIFEGIYFTKTMFIVSNKYKEIAQQIGEKLDRGSTAIYAKGMYTKEKRMMLWCVASRGEVAKIKQIAEEIDPRAFIVISSAREAWGKGFK